MRTEKDQLTTEMNNKEKEYTDKIKALEEELNVSKLEFKTAESQYKENVDRSSKYKTKLKYAISIINDLNNMVIQYSTKPETNTSETQTGNER